MREIRPDAGGDDRDVDLRDRGVVVGVREQRVDVERVAEEHVSLQEQVGKEPIGLAQHVVGHDLHVVVLGSYVDRRHSSSVNSGYISIDQRVRCSYPLGERIVIAIGVVILVVVAAGVRAAACLIRWFSLPDGPCFERRDPVEGES